MTRDEKIGVAVSITSVLAFALGYRRFAGGLATANGIYDLHQRRNVAGVTNLAIGGSFLLFPGWPEGLTAAIRGSKNGSGQVTTLPAAVLPDPVPFDKPIFQRISLPSLDRALLGGWTELDVRDIRDASVAAKANSLQPGDVASLVLSNKGAAPMVFNARVIPGGSGGLYAAQWASKPPESGPQMAEFAPAHVFAVH